MNILERNIDYDRPVAIAEGVYWVGFAADGRLQCNPYLIVDGDEAILIDGGSRPDFSTVMRKVMQVGVMPRQISHLVYQHYDPDLCGSLPNLEDLIDHPDLKVVSKHENNHFIRHYAVRSPLLCIDAMGRQLTMRSGRVLRFLPTPFAHSAGSFITYDTKTATLFTSDLFGSAGAIAKWRLFGRYEETCTTCVDTWPDSPDVDCARSGCPCPWSGLHFFHRVTMPSTLALRHAINVVKSAAPSIIAPQHGSILSRPRDIAAAIERLASMDDIGIDGVLEARGLAGG